MAFAGALFNRGKVVLDGGDVHPHSLLRHIMQDVHFWTLFASNYSDLLGQEQIKKLHDHSRSYFSLFAKIGLITIKDHAAFIEKSRLEDYEKVRALIAEFKITELEHSRDIFTFARNFHSRLKRDADSNLLNVLCDSAPI
jgi:hypothetical protein